MKIILRLLKYFQSAERILPGEILDTRADGTSNINIVMNKVPTLSISTCHHEMSIGTHSR